MVTVNKDKNKREQNTKKKIIICSKTYVLNKVKCHCGWTAGVCWDAKIKVSTFAKLVGQ